MHNIVHIVIADPNGGYYFDFSCFRNVIKVNDVFQFLMSVYPDYGTYIQIN